MRTHRIAAWIFARWSSPTAAPSSTRSPQPAKIPTSAERSNPPPSPDTIFPLSVSQPNTPAAFCELGVHFPLLRTYFTVFIYGVFDRTQQDAIVASLRNAPRGPNAKKILVQFFEKENWRPWSDPASGRSGGNRGPETPIATHWIP